MKALILAAGFGTRLNRDFNGYQGLRKEEVTSWVNGKPKGLVEIEGMPIVDHLLFQINKSGIENHKVYVHTNSLYYDNYLTWARSVGVPSRNVINNGISVNEERNGPFKDLYLALEHIGIEENLLVIASDTLVYDHSGQHYDFKLAIKKLREDNTSRLVVYQVKGPKIKNHGVAEVNNEGRIIGFEEKPENPKSNLAVASVYFYTPELLKLVRSYSEILRNPENRERHLLEFLPLDQVNFKVEEVASRRDIGRLEDVLKANGVTSEENQPSKVI